MKMFLRLLGFVVAMVGIVWIGQGTGYFPHPSTSFMINQMPWAYRGGVLAVIGLVVIFVARGR